MKKNNNKGFLLTELLITATLVCTVLIFLYTQFYTIKRSYDTSFKYNTINELYALDNIRSFLIDNGDVYALKILINNSNPYLEINSNTIKDNNSFLNKLFVTSNIKKVYLTKENISAMKEQLNNQNNNELEPLRKFVNNIDYNEQADSNIYRLIAEFNDETFATLLLGGE